VHAIRRFAPPGSGALAASLALAFVPPGESDRDRFVATSSRAERVVEVAERCASIGFSGAVLAARDGEVVVALGVGGADLDGEVANTANTLFELASASKQFTAAAVLTLVARKKLTLDDPIAKHLPGVPQECAAITVRHLLQHTSGIPGSNAEGSGDDLAAVLPQFLRGGPRHAPGTHWEYWNQGYALAAAIITKVSGQPYVEHCRKGVFEKAKLKVTCFTGDEPSRGATVAIGRSRSGEPRSALDHPYGSYGYQYQGMGGIVSNVWDLWRWDRALCATKVLDAKSKEALFEPGLNDYALGWFVRRNASGRLVQSHGGSVRGFVCDVRRYPDQDGCVFVLCNRDGLPVYRFADLIERALFDESFEMPPRPLDPELQAAIAGEYAADSGARLVVAADGVATTATIAPAGGPAGAGGGQAASSAHLGADEKGSVVLDDGSRSTMVSIERGDGGSVLALELDGTAYRRARPADG
jgi:CubicO group peptidase (beta-lactamase class C family)